MMYLEYERLYRATRRFLLLGMLVIGFGSFVKANGPVAGRVTDEDGFELPGVTVVFKGEAGGTVTGTDGRYQLTKPQGGGILVFSFIGMETLEIKVSNEEVVDAVLVAAITQLSEVVAVGYGSQRKSDITGSVVSVGREQFNKGISASPGELLQGKVSGVSITSSSGAPGSDQRIIIRGQGSIRQGTGPLFVIDGFPIGLSGTGTGSNPLNFLNSDDIESIDVLKDASATAIYGSRGANGVVLITTRKGKEGRSTVMVSGGLGVSSLARKIPVFSADEFRSRIVEIGGKLEDRGGNTDWQEELTRTAITQDHNVVLSGGAEGFTYRASVGYLNQEGIVLNSEIERYTGRVGVTQKLLQGRLNIDYNLSTSIEKGSSPNTGTLVSQMLDFNPTYPARDEAGNPVKYPDLTNPLIGAELYGSFSESRRTQFSISPALELADGLVYKTNFGYENRSSDSDYQRTASTDPFEEGRLQQDYFNGTNLLIENYLTYNLKHSAHNVTLLGGHSYQETFDRWRSWSVDLFPENGVEPRYNPGLGQRIDLVGNKPGGWALINELQSFFGRVNYDYRSRYMLTATLRADGSSKFGENNKYGVFPSFAGAWRISEEPFMGYGLVSNLKLRFGWGQTGNQEIPSKITQALYTTRVSGSESYPLHESDAYPAGTTFVRLANPDIQWEVATQTNFGLDFGLFNGALSGALDYFHKVSDNILLEVVPSDPIQPATTYWTNVKDMTITNKGLELAMDYKYQTFGDFAFGVGGTFSFLDNVVEGSPFTVLTTGSASGSGLTGATINGIINGHPVSSFYMQKFIGIGEDGLSQFENSEDGGRMVVGSALPDLLYSFYLSLSYRRVNLGLNFNGVSGNKIYNNTAMNKFYKAMLANSQNTTDLAVAYPDESLTNSSSVSTRYLEDGAYLRLNNATLGYNFKLGSQDWLQELRFSITGQNLFVWTDYSGFDPEVNQDRSVGGIQSFGIDLDGYPRAKTFVFNLSATF